MAKLVVITVAILLAAGSAHAATPRLSCEGVTQDDLIAVCGNEKLSRTDRMTTEMFESARRIDRAATLSVARAFLKIARAQFLIAAYTNGTMISVPLSSRNSVGRIAFLILSIASSH